MNVQVKSSNGITLVPIESRLMGNRKIFLEGEINSSVACEFVKKVMHLNKEDSRSPIHVFVNSPGGEITSGLLIYDVIQQSIAPIRLYCIGKAYSMAAVLFASGMHGRYMLPHSELMIHEPLLGNKVNGNISTIKSISDTLLETRQMINRILAKHTKKSEEEIENATGFDHYFSAQESIDFGLADSVVGFNDILMEVSA